MAIYDAGARFDKDSYYQMSVNEETDEASIAGEMNGEPVEFKMGGIPPMIVTYGGTTQEDADEALIGGGHLNASWQEINDAFREGKRIVVITNPYLETTLATHVTGEIIGVSGFISEAGLLDNKHSAQCVYGQNNEGLPRFISFRCDNATDYPAFNLMS